MKAYKQINLQTERRLIWTFTSLLIFMGVFIMITPVFAQFEDHAADADARTEVNIVYDEDGNHVGSDTVQNWYWADKKCSQQEFDSIWQNIAKDFKEYFPGNIDDIGFHNFPHGPPTHNFWHWNESDSSAFSYLDGYFDEDFLNEFNGRFPDSLAFQNWTFHQDSLLHSFQDFDFFDNTFHEKFDDFNERFQNYNEEHRQLIDKYFGDPVETNND